jgi:hypothetical protein
MNNRFLQMWNQLETESFFCRVGLFVFLFYVEHFVKKNMEFRGVPLDGTLW